MVTAISVAGNTFAVSHIDMMGIAVADYEERRRSVLPFVLRSFPVRAHAAPRTQRMCRVELKGGMVRGSGKRLLLAGRITTGARS